MFLFFGGYDKNQIQLKITNILLSEKKYELIIDKKFKPHFKKDIKNFYTRNNFYKRMSSADIVIISGGLILFDAFFLKLPIICIPQYLHQKKNVKKLKKKYLLNYLDLNKNIKKKLPSLINRLKVNTLLIKKIKYDQNRFVINLKYKKIMKKIKNIYEN